MPSEIDEIDLVSTFLIIEGIVNLKKKFLEEMPWNLHIVYLIKIWRRVKRTDIYLGIWLGKQRSTAVSAGEKYKWSRKVYYYRYKNWLSYSKPIQTKQYHNTSAISHPTGSKKQQRSVLLLVSVKYFTDWWVWRVTKILEVNFSDENEDWGWIRYS